MRGKPLIPFAVTAVVGILLMISLSLIGLNQSAEPDEAEGAGEEVTIDDPIAAGEEFVQGSCIGCHGGDLTGAVGPNLTALEGKYSGKEIANIILTGRGQMPAMPHSEAEAEAIATYLLSISE